MRQKEPSALDYRNWLQDCLYMNGRDEFIPLVCHYGENHEVKDALDRIDQKPVKPIINRSGEVCCGDCRFVLPVIMGGTGEYMRKRRSRFCCQCGRAVMWE